MRSCCPASMNSASARARCGPLPTMTWESRSTWSVFKVPVAQTVWKLYNGLISPGVFVLFCRILERSRQQQCGCQNDTSCFWDPACCLSDVLEPCCWNSTPMSSSTPPVRWQRFCMMTVKDLSKVGATLAGAYLKMMFALLQKQQDQMFMQ